MAAAFENLGASSHCARTPPAASNVEARIGGVEGDGLVCDDDHRAGCATHNEEAVVRLEPRKKRQRAR